MKVLLRQRRRRFHRDVGIGVGWIADDQHLHVARSHRVERLALLDEDFRVVEQQVLAFHPGTARLGADQHRDVGVLERDLRVAGAEHAGEQRKGAILEFHHDAGQRGLRLFERKFEQLQDHRLILPQHFARCDPEDEGVANLAGGAGDGDADGCFHERLLAVVDGYAAGTLPRGCGARCDASEACSARSAARSYRDAAF